MDSLEQFAQHSWYYLTHLFSQPAANWDSLAWFLACMLIFIPLAVFMPNKKGQPYFRRDMITDGIYWFMGPLAYGPVAIKCAIFISSLGAIKYVQDHGHLESLPVVVQALIILLLTDILQYWAHRGFHTGSLWKFHAIHHSSENIDWLSAARFHPVNIILYSTSINALVWTLGFSSDAFFVLIPFNAIYSPLVHANLNWTYGPFKYVLASPVFHRWHHTYPEEGGNKNFAPTFPFLDLMFGTFYMPKDKRPQVFGTPYDPVTGNLMNQLIYPFKNNTLAHAAKQTAAPEANTAI